MMVATVGPIGIFQPALFGGEVDGGQPAAEADGEPAPLFFMRREFNADGRVLQFFCEVWDRRDSGHSLFVTTPDPEYPELEVGRGVIDLSTGDVLKLVASGGFERHRQHQDACQFPGPRASGALYFVFDASVIRFSGDRWDIDVANAFCREEFVVDTARNAALTLRAEWVADGEAIPSFSQCDCRASRRRPSSTRGNALAF